MKLIIQSDRIAGTATDDYTGPDDYITAPDDYDPTREYHLIDGVLTLPPPAPVTTITMRQCRLQLLTINKLADVDAAIASLPEPEKSAAQIEWEYTATVERDSPLISQLGPALGLDDEQLDALFSEAAGL